MPIWLIFVGLKKQMDQVIEIDQGQGYSEGQGTSSGRPSEAFQIQNYVLHRMSILEVIMFFGTNFFLGGNASICFFLCKLLCEK